MAGSLVLRNMLSVLNENAKPELEVEESEESVRLRLRYEEGEALKPQDFSLKQLQLVLRLTRKYECLRSHAFFITLISDPGLDSGKADTHNWVYFGLFIIAAEFDLQDIAQCVLQQSAHVWASGGNKGYSCTSPLSWTQRQAESVPLRYYVALVRAHLDVPPGKVCDATWKVKIAEAFGRHLQDAKGDWHVWDV